MAIIAARINTRSFQWQVSDAGAGSAHIDPASRPVALEHSLENVQLPQAIHKLRIFGRFAGRADRSVKTPEDLLEGVIVAFAVTTWKIGAAAGCRLEQRRIFYEDLIARIAMADPEFVGTLLVPCNGRS